MLATDVKNTENLTQSNIFLRQTKVSEAVCKRDWHNVRSYLFFNVRKFLNENFGLSVKHWNSIFL